MTFNIKLVFDKKVLVRLIILKKVSIRYKNLIK